MKFSHAAISLLAMVALSSSAFSEELKLKLRGKEKAGDSWEGKTKEESWAPSETAIVICDMWDYHHCRNATVRVGEIAPRMNEVVSSLRDRGVFVIHAPSSCLDFYKDHPARKRAGESPKAANLPGDIENWCKSIPGEEMEHYPIDQSDGGEDDDLKIHEKWAAHLDSIGRNPKAPWKRQIETIEIDESKDIISDKGDEIWNSMEARGIKNVLLVGVHTNMCVLGRPFGLRQMAQNGKNVALVRDMTDTMYNPTMSPFVSHYKGTELIIEHIEKYVAPTITSDQILGGNPFLFKWDVPTRVVIAIAEPGYKTWETLPALAKKIWTADQGYNTEIIIGDPKEHNFPGLTKALKNADVLVLSVRRQALPADQLQAIRDHLAAGKPLLAIRTSSHGLTAVGKGPKGNPEWPDFDKEVLGAAYETHAGHKLIAEFTAAAGAKAHPILEGVELPFQSGGGFYFSSDLAKTATPILIGKMEGMELEPIAWTNSYGKSRVFYTCLGQEEEFALPAFQKLMGNAMEWLRVLPSDIPNAEGY
ncbi:isochorismatase family protein [Verrucomicrobiales bacterium]|nr:isochorismatase family protein [Verrucomicrobiales bacterium]